MRSQVQVLAGPPAIPAGHSAVGSEPGAPAASLGRAGAARPSRWHAHRRPPGPPTQAAGPMTTTHRGRSPSLGRQPRGRCGNLALQPAPVPTAQPLATALLTPAWPAWSLGRSSAAASAPHLVRVRHRPTDHRDLGSIARVRACSAVHLAVQDAAAHRDLTRFCGDGCPPPRPGPHRRRLDAGRVDTGRPDPDGLDTGCWLDAPRGSRRLGDPPTRTAQQHGLPGRPGHRRNSQLHRRGLSHGHGQPG
jgi:hypothetical protein